MNKHLLVSCMLLSASSCFTYDKKNVGETYKLDLNAIAAYQYEVTNVLITFYVDKFPLIFTLNQRHCFH